ncbi:glycosyltransferase family 4 protein [Vibrio mimicus]|uniref:glycosyltransferase family 4 protein n=1 Tax=Vibrio mimicus TaxID=674 RepID=UPI00165223E2|nr:glycosyltransferase [Vibrio mimicus]
MLAKKVLLVAYSCEPGFSSEREVGWKWATLLSDQCDLYVLTRSNNKSVIEKYLQEHSIELKAKFIYFDLPSWAKFWKKGERGLYLYYAIWQLFAMLHCRKLHKNIRFDITHYLTFGSFLLPQFSFLMPTKYILGPVGGGENVPINFLEDFSFKGKIQIYFRYFYQKLQILNPIFLANCHCADHILVRTPESLGLLPRWYRLKAELCLETGTPEELANSAIETQHHNDIFTIVTVGRLIPTKINILTFRAISKFREIYSKPFRFIVVGDGPERERLQNFCNENGLSEVEFLGWKKREEVFNIVSSSDVYFSTTFKEGGTWAFFEAIALKIPVVCLKTSGPDIIVPDNGGIKVSPTNVEETSMELAKALKDLAQCEIKRDILSETALIHIKNTLSWKSIIDKTVKSYEEALK